MVLATGEISKGSQEAQAKSLIMKAWRERWTEVQWGINIRKLIDDSADGSFLADCILQQALSGPGPNSLVLSYLTHSIHSQTVTTSSVLLSVSKYEAFHKPFCVTSLLDLLDSIKDRIILNDAQEKGDCMHLALALQSVVWWLLSCMYISLENLSDVISDFSAEAEDSKIVLKCKSLVDHFLTDPFLATLVHVANREDEEAFSKIKSMGKEVEKFVDGHHQKDIAHVTSLVDKLSAPKIQKSSPTLSALDRKFDNLQIKVGNPAIHAVMMKSILQNNSQNIPQIVFELLLVKQLQDIDLINFYSEVMQSCLMGLANSFGKEPELTFVGFTFLQLPSLLQSVRAKLLDTSDSFVKGMEMFLLNESSLNIADAKLHCCSFEFILSSFVKIGIISDPDKKFLMKTRATKGPVPSKPMTTGNSPVILRAEATLSKLLNTLDGDYQKSQDAILAVLCDVISTNDKTFNLILTAAATTGRLQQFTSKLIKLNQASRQVIGEVTKAANTRALIFDLSFLMLTYIAQAHGDKALSSGDETDSFFEDWYKDCMVENHVAKNPDIIINRCEPTKVELLLNQYVQGDTDLKTSLVLWHELCVNSVGVIRELLCAWEADSVSFNDVKRVLDVFRSKICSLPVCITAWLCAYIQVTPEEKCGKAKEIIGYFLNPVLSYDNQDHFKERCALTNQILSKMMSSILPQDKTSLDSPTSYNFESKPVAQLYEKCWECMSKTGLIDVQTAVNLQHLLQMSGPHFFVQNLVDEMLRLQHSQELSQRCELLYGIFQYDIKNCTPALVRVIIPTILQFWTNDSCLMEPQIKALVKLTVDCVLSFYYHATSPIKEERSDDEPQAKRRKMLENNGQKESLLDLHLMLKEMYDEFDKNLLSMPEATPAVVFVLQFLDHLSLKTPTLTLLTSLPHQVVMHLLSLLSEEISPEMLLGMFCLTTKSSRLNCAQALCLLKHLQPCEEEVVEIPSPAPGS